MPTAKYLMPTMREIMSILTEADAAPPEPDADDVDAIHNHLRDYDQSGDDSFHVVHHRPERHNKLRPLVVLVHPGDMIETPNGWDDSTAYEKVARFSYDNQKGTANELKRWREAGADAVALHRGSCSQLSTDYLTSHVCDEFVVEIETLWKHGSVVVGDDLDAASAWIIQNLHVEDRPHIYLAGAYSCADHGCLTAVGKAIEKVVGSQKITVSDWSPPSNSDQTHVWRPGNKRLNMWKAQHAYREKFGDLAPRAKR